MYKSLLYPVASACRRLLPLDGMWKFKFDKKSEGNKEGWNTGLSDYDLVPVPSSFADLFTDKDSREFCGDFWYETEFVAPSEWKDRELVVRFGSVTHRATVYINGEEVTSHVGGFLPFNADITGKVKFDEMNKLVVKANNELSEKMIPCGKTSVRSDGTKYAQAYFDFFNYSGIHRSVKLMALPKLSITDYETTYEIKDDRSAIVNYNVCVEDFASDNSANYEVKVCLKDKEGNVVASSDGEKGKLKVENANLWNVRAAYLYTIVIDLVDKEGNKIDEYVDKIGIRTFEIKDGHFLLNGKPVYLRGFGKHEDSDIRGRGLDLATIKRDYECMKWIGSNCFRTSHYPYAEEMYRMADEEGFLIIDETPAVGMFESLMNAVDAASGSKAVVHWFEKETTPELLEHHKECIKDMIKRDKNHPSVIAWSLLNEPETIYECAVPYFEAVFECARQEDPQKRPRTFALVINSTPDNCKCWHLCDFVSLNRYYGWYVMGGYNIVSAEQAFRAEMDKWAKIRGDKPFIFTEYGADTSGELHKLPSVMWSQEYQDEYYDMNHSVFDSYPWVQGELVWNFADFQTGEGIIRMNGNKKGIFTRNRQPKSAAYVLKHRWEELPLDYKK
ncbi:MAG: beta-glucuronidase [Butyrivibrio sp.]|nr:beta-glucuronidase [Butyrivibrio sp.]